MKKSLWKNNLKEIIKTRRRFLSILVMAFLGVGFFAGLVATGPDMQDSLDKYADTCNLFDIDIVCNLGLTDNDLSAVKNIDGVKSAYGVQSQDSLVVLNQKENVCKLIEYNENINKPYLISGRLPENSKECVLDNRYSITENVSDYIGKKILIKNDDVNSENEPIFKYKELTIVGVSESPLYISSDRGNSTIGNGDIAYYVYVDDDVINLDYYSNIYVTVNEAEKTMSNSSEYLSKVDSVKDKIEDIKSQREEERYNSLINEAKSKLKYSNTTKNISESNFNNLEKEINKIEKAKWYINDRKSNTGYTNIIDAIKTITNISRMFPVIFYLIAILISLCSMTRMIEEERVEIGTLKALGYNNLQIISKYILYAMLACIIGGFLGMSVGFYLLPNIVWTIYSTIYTIPNFYVTYRLYIGILGIVLAFLCIGGATALVAYRELKNMPSVLMRPKSPKNGKRIILEKMNFIWKHLNFSQKITTRNIFRYKKRAFMTIIGIAGCTGLMLTGFGLRDSVMGITSEQFGNIFKYEISITLSNLDSIDKVRECINSNENIENYSEIYATTAQIKGDNSNYDVTVFVPDSNDDFENVCNLKDIETAQKLKLDNSGIIISAKVAEFLNVKQGDNVVLIDSENVEHTLKIQSICENYVSHYIYMSKEFYENNLKDYQSNMILLNTKNISEQEKSKFSEDILKINGVASVNLISDTIEAVNDMLNSMNYVVIILIVSSALLAFVVLYNLANINIGERQREIATLKVLGFYDKEVDNYINKENIIFTIIGVIIGLFFGYFLTKMIITSIEIDILRLARKILPISYVYSSIITIAFSTIVNRIIHFVLKKIDMIESLKSVE